MASRPALLALISLASLCLQPCLAFSTDSDYCISCLGPPTGSDPTCPDVVGALHRAGDGSVPEGDLLVSSDPVQLSDGSTTCCAAAQASCTDLANSLALSGYGAAPCDQACAEFFSNNNGFPLKTAASVSTSRDRVLQDTSGSACIYDVTDTDSGDTIGCYLLITGFSPDDCVGFAVAVDSAITYPLLTSGSLVFYDSQNSICNILADDTCPDVATILDAPDLTSAQCPSDFDSYVSEVLSSGVLEPTSDFTSGSSGGPSGSTGVAPTPADLVPSAGPEGAAPVTSTGARRLQEAAQAEHAVGRLEGFTVIGNVDPLSGAPLKATAKPLRQTEARTDLRLAISRP